MQLYLISKDGKALKKWIFKYMNLNFHSEESKSRPWNNDRNHCLASKCLEQLSVPPKTGISFYSAVSVHLEQTYNF